MHACPPFCSRQRGAPKPDPTQKVMRKQEITSVKVHHSRFLKIKKICANIVFFCPYKTLQCFPFSCAALRRQQDGGFFKSPHYPGYPFLMIPDLTNPYLSNGSLSPSARTVSLTPVGYLALFLHALSLISVILCKKKRRKKKTLAVRESSLRTARPPYSLQVASQGAVLTTSLFF